MTNNSTRLLGLLLQWSYNSDDGQNKSLVVWSPKNISSFLMITEDEALTSINILLRDGHIITCLNGYQMTKEGNDYYQSISNIPHENNTARQGDWKTEVLSGMDKKGRETKIKNAALPKPNSPDGKDMTDIIIRNMERRDISAKIINKICSNLGMEKSEYEKRLHDGSIHLCKGYGDNPQQHVGIFDHKGKGWQHRCRECRKQKRKENE